MFGQSLLSAFGSAACTTDTDQLFATDVQTTSLATYQLNNATTSIPSNTYPGTPSGITYAAGKFGNAAVFNGSSSKIVTTLNPNGFSQITLSCWIKTSVSSGTGSGHIISANDGGNWCFISIGKTTGIVTFAASNNGSGMFTATHTGAINDGNWHHICATYNGTNAILYIDGTGYTPVSATNSLSVNIGLGIGYRNTASPSSTYYSGSIDQVRIFNSGLSQAAVTALYNETTTTATYPYVDYVGANPNSIAYYKMSNATDQFGNYNGTATDVNFNTEGKFGFAGAFNGSSSKIDLGNNSSNNSSTISVSLWFKTSGHSGTATLINNGGANSGETGYFLGLTSSGYLRFNATGVGSIYGSVNYADGSWHNVIMTLNNGAYNIYVDGNTTPVITGTGIFTSTATRPTWIGQFSYTSAAIEFFNGSIDQIRIYDSALSAANVTTLYEEIECPALATVYYLIVAGGGGGGAGYSASTVGTGGGGGAGGLITNIGGIGLSLNYSIPYAITVGTGGNGGAPGGNSFNGGDSVFSGTGTTTIQATGGGRGGMYNNSNIGGNGGSGGGTGYSGGNAAGGLGNTPSTTPSQGNNGGYYYESSPYGGSGGGGAGSAGSNGPTNVDGGSGVANSITGASVFYAAGGGGGKPGTSGTQAGGSGIGGNGGNANSLNGTSGAANTGSGGGGAGHPLTSGSNSGSAGAGGSGIVILRYPTSKVSSFAVTGTLNTPTPIILGTDSVLKFTTGTGTVTFS